MPSFFGRIKISIDKVNPFLIVFLMRTLKNIDVSTYTDNNLYHYLCNETPELKSFFVSFELNLKIILMAENTKPLQ